MNFWFDFWQILVWMLWVIACVGYLFALFAIVGDLLRDHKLNGWWKALWIVCLLFLPFITVLVYVIARGEGMASRSERSARDAAHLSQASLREVAGKSPAEEITAASALLTAGSINQQEFETLKAMALA